MTIGGTMRRFRVLCWFAACMLTAGILVLLLAEPIRPSLIFGLVSAALLLAILPVMEPAAR